MLQLKAAKCYNAAVMRNIAISCCLFIGFFAGAARLHAAAVPLPVPKIIFDTDMYTDFARRALADEFVELYSSRVQSEVTLDDLFG